MTHESRSAAFRSSEVIPKLLDEATRTSIERRFAERKVGSRKVEGSWVGERRLELFLWCVSREL